MNRILCLFVCMLCLSPLLMAQNCDGVWKSGFQRPGVLNQPQAMAFDEANNYLYVGDPGQFGGDPDIEKVGRWDGENWVGLGDFICTSCGSGRINALELGAQGDLYIGGFFEGVIGANGVFVPSKNVIKWNASTESFESLGFGVEANQVYALSFWNDTLVVGGRITAAKTLSGDIPVNNIALYDENTQSWSPMGSGIESFNLTTDDNGDVLAMARQWDGTLYVGGSFSKINGNTLVYSMASWTPTGGWAPMGDGVRRINDIPTPATIAPAVVRDITVDASTDAIYVVGDLGPFNAAGSGLAKCSWPGLSWTYPGGLGNKPPFTGRWQTHSIYFRPYTNQIYVGGNFNSDDADPFSPVPGEYIAWFDVSDNSWHSLGEGITGAIPGEAVTAISEGPGEKVFIGGNFNKVDSLAARFMASWDPQDTVGADWDILGQGLPASCDEVFSLGFHHQYVGGTFETMGGIPTSGVAWRLWNRWIPNYLDFTSANNAHSIRTMEFGTSIGTLYGGVFDTVKSGFGTITAAGMIYQNFIGMPQPLATSLGGPGNVQTVYDLTEWQGEIVAAGDFTSIDGVPVQGLGIRDANGTWTEMAAIGSGTVKAILNDGDSMLYIAGNFRTVNGISVDGVAMFDGTNWLPMGQGFGFYNNALALGKDPVTGEIAVGGGFFTAYQSNGAGLSSAGIAFWDGTQWKSRGEVNAQITTPQQYAQVVRAIEFLPDGTLYIGGEFSGVDNVPAQRVARYSPGLGWEDIGGGISGSDCDGYPVVNVLSYSDDALMVGGKFSRAGGKQAHGIAIFDQSIQSVRILPDTFDMQCDLTVIRGLPGFTNWQWSTGDTGDSAAVQFDYFDTLRNDNGRVWVYASAEKEGCVLVDSIEVPFLATGFEAVGENGYFNEGDSTYFWYTPILDTTLIDYDLWIIHFNTFITDFSDTAAYQFPCPNQYEYSIRVQAKDNSSCVSFLQQTAHADYTTPKKIIEIVETSGGDCLQTPVFGGSGGWINPLWSNGEMGQWALIDESFMQGQDRKWLYLTADTAYLNFTDSLVCTFTDSVEMVRWENFDDGFDQQYTWTEGDSFRVDFYEDYVGNPYITTWDFGDGSPLLTVNLKWDTLNFPFTHYYPGTGTYTVTAITNAWGCQDSVDTVQFEVMVGQTSIQQLEGPQLQVSPNPTTGTFTLTFPAKQHGKLELSIQDLRGAQVYYQAEDSFQAKELQVHPHSLTSGLYILRVETGGQSYQQKLRIY